MNELRGFYEKFPEVTYSKNETILAQGIEPDYAYAVKSGIIRINSITPDGDERTNSFAVRDELVPICWLFNKTPMTLFYYSAHTDCQLYKITKDAFSTMLEHNANLSAVLLEHFVNDYVTKSMQIRALEQPRARIKLLLIIDSLCLRYGSRILSDTVRIKVPLTQQDIASLTGLARETVALEVSKLKHDNVLSYANKIYTVNTAKLHQLLQYDYNVNVTIQA